MKQNLKDFLFNLVISMVIGLFVGMTHMVIKDINAEKVEELIIFPIIGGVIGTISRFVFIYIIGIKQKNVMAAFISVFIIIGGISFMPFLYYYFMYNYNISITGLVSVLTTSEVFGISFCYYSYKRYLEFNSKLINKKKQLLRKS